jgi:hypothetical protein
MKQEAMKIERIEYKVILYLFQDVDSEEVAVTFPEGFVPIIPHVNEQYSLDGKTYQIGSVRHSITRDKNDAGLFRHDVMISGLWIASERARPTR